MYPDDVWLTAEQICEARPAIEPRTLRQWAEHNYVTFSKRGVGKTAQRLFRLRDIDALLEATVVPVKAGPLVDKNVQEAQSGPLASKAKKK